MSNKIDDVIFVAPYCENKFEVGQIINLCLDGYWIVKMWGIRPHPVKYGSSYNYGKTVVITKNNAWSPDRLGEAISRWLDTHESW